LGRDRATNPILLNRDLLQADYLANKVKEDPPWVIRMDRMETDSLQQAEDMDRDPQTVVAITTTETDNPTHHFLHGPSPRTPSSMARNSSIAASNSVLVADRPVTSRLTVPARLSPTWNKPTSRRLSLEEEAHSPTTPALFPDRKQTPP
jgi:hypothetical protein